MADGMLFALILSIGVFYILFHLVRKIIPLIMHAILGMIIFWALGFFGILQVPLNWITVGIAAFAGVIGVLIVIGLAALGVPL